MELNEITYQICSAIYEVHKVLGLGLLESVYKAALTYELGARSLSVQTQLALPVHYKEVRLDIGFRLDILVKQRVIIEVKSIEMLHDVHKKQLLAYLRLTGLKPGILANFNVSTFEDKVSLIRIIN